ncbi:LysR family transcriptional regulator [Leisingera aquimarina]|uniref:LysR family transcriptional regulator n=1 Tax=Leisingera aquimarina TaxID=476529 RepID=UPI00041F262C|nr:LysR family transcriptional regulator [Leisingera aquimarina]
MAIMQKMNADLASMDFRVLRFLRLLLQTGSVTRSAELLEISQPAASRILARIRDLTGDPLLIRTQAGYQLTDHALSLQAPVLDAINSIEAVFQPPHFSPENSRHCFRIAATDYAAACVIGPLMDRLAKTAPHIQANVTPLVPNSFSMILEGEIDFVFYAGLRVKGDLIVKKLFTDSYVLLMRKGHPLLELANRKGFLDPPDIAPYRQIEFSYPTVDRLRADTVMRIERDEAPAMLSVPFFTAMPFHVANSDAVAAVPSRLGEQLSAFSSVVSVPFRSGAQFPYYLLWHERGQFNPAMRWFVDEVARTVA